MLIEISTPEKLLVSQECESVQVPGKEGEMGILPGHAALLSELGEGQLSYTSAGRISSVRISGGYVEVRDNHIRVLADKAE